MLIQHNLQSSVLKKNAHLEIEKSYEEELHLRCISIVDTIVDAKTYLRMNGEKLKSYCESVEWGN